MILLKGILVAKTPFMIGSGSGGMSDSDVLKTVDGLPFLPGTTLAGVTRHYLDEWYRGAKRDADGVAKCDADGEATDDIEETTHFDDGRAYIKHVYGYHDKKQEVDFESNINFYDAFYIPPMNQKDGEKKKRITSILDSVRLENKLAVDKTKFDYEVVEAGARFGFRVQLDELLMKLPVKAMPQGDEDSADDTDAENMGEAASAEYARGGASDANAAVTSASKDAGVDAEMLKCGLTLLAQILHGFSEGFIRIGAKTTRGFGEFGLTDVKIQHFDLKKASKQEADAPPTPETGVSLGREEYLDLDSEWSSVGTPFEYQKLLASSADEGKGAEGQTPAGFVKKSCELALKHFLFVRDYATVSKVDPNDDNSKFVDAQTLTDANGDVFLSGTAWAGVFRQHFAYILRKVGKPKDEIDAFLDKVFGFQTKLVNGVLRHEERDKEKVSKSILMFSPSVISKNQVTMMNRTRTAVDRFTGSALSGALYTERVAFAKDGTKAVVELVVTIKKSALMQEEWKLLESLIDTTLDDLKTGMLAVGGNTSIGGGIFEAFDAEKTGAEDAPKEGGNR